MEFRTFSNRSRLIVRVAGLLLVGLGLLPGRGMALAGPADAPANTPPTISAIANQNINEDSALGPLAFTVGDAETPPEQLQLFVSSSNTTLFPANRITLGGSGANRTVSLSPAPERSGSALITLIVSDGAATAQAPFLVTVAAVDDPPTIVGPADQTVEADRVLGPLPVTVDDIDTAAAGLALSGQSSDAALLPPSAFAFGGSGNARTVTLTPAPGLTGSAAVTLTVTDGTSAASAVFNLTVTPRNQPPTVSVIPDQQMPEDSTRTVAFIAADSETAGDDLIYTVSSSDQSIVPNLNLSLGGSGQNRVLSITPAPDRFGIVGVTISVSDGEFTVTRSFVLTVLPVDDPPAIDPIGSRVTPEDTPVEVALVISDVDTPIGQLAITGASTDQRLLPDGNIAVKTVGNARALLLTPAANQFGSAVVVVTVSDGSNFAVASFQLIVTAVNDPPTVVPFPNQRVNEDTTFGPFTFVVQDVESPAGAITATATAANTALITPTNVAVSGSGVSRTLTVTPTANAYGASFVTIWVGDGEDVGSFTFTLFVDSVNDRPEMDDLPDVSTPEDTALTISFRAWDVETPFSQLLYSARSSDTQLLPQANLQFSRTSTQNRLRMTPAPNLFGSTVVSVTVSDGQLAVTKSFVLTVVSVNDKPTLSTPPNLTTPQGISVTTSLTVNDQETPPDDLVVTFLSSNPALFPDGSLRLGGSGSGRSLTLHPAPGQYGVATITIVVDDGADKSSTAFKVTVLAPPTIGAIADQTTDEDRELAFDFAIADPDSDLRSLRLSATSGNPTLIPAGNITFAGTGSTRTARILPAADLSGTARLTVTVSDGSLSASAGFTLTVRAVNDPPTIAPIPAQLIDEGGSGVVTLALADVDNDPAGLILTAFSSDQALIPDSGLIFSGSGSNPKLAFTAAPGRSGAATITVTVSDGQAQAGAAFVVTVNGAPAFSGLSAVEVAEDSVETIHFTITDPELDPAKLLLSVVSGDPSLIRNQNLVLGGAGAERTLRIQPEPDRHGTTTVTLSADDGRLRTTYAFPVTVLPVNDGPSIGSIADQVTDEDTTNGPVPFAVGDIDSPLASLQLFGSSSDPILLPHTSIRFGGEGNNRTVSLTPAPNLFGQAVVTVTVSDGQLLASTTYTLTVLPVNDPPVIAPVADQITPEDTPITVTFQVSDIDSPLSNVTVSARSDKQELVQDSDIHLAGSGAERTVTLTPRPDQVGMTRITLKASDGSLTSERTFSLAVSGGNDAPFLDPIADQSMDEDTVLAVELSLFDIDTPLEAVQVAVVSGDQRIVPVGGFWTEGLGSRRTLYIRPAKDRNGSLPVTVQVSDGEFVFERSFRLTVRPLNDPPVAVDDAVRVISTPSINIGVLANDWDVDRDALQVVAVSPGAYGAVSINSDNTLRYLMPAGFVGTEVIDYTIDDGHGERAGARLTIVVIDAPGESAAAIHAIAPTGGDNHLSAQIVITGANLRGPALASLGPYPLPDVRVESPQRMVATVPAFLPPGLYDLIVTLGSGETVIRRADFRVTTRGVALTDVRPDRSAEDVPLLMNVYGLNFTPEARVLLDDQPLETRFLSDSHLQAMVPPHPAPPGVYPVTVRRGDGLQATQAAAFTVYSRDSDDLFAYPVELWSEPGALYAGQSVLLGLRVHRQMGDAPLLDVPVAFYSGEPGEQSYLGRAVVPLLEGDDQASTLPLAWTPPAPGNYTLYAVLDPDNRLAESNEENNILKRSVTVLPTAVDMTPPAVTGLVLREGMDTTDSPTISIQVQAADGGSGVRAVYLVEYEFARGAGRWTPVQWSGWLDYTGDPTVYTWRLLPSPGVRYLYAWAADNSGNISPQPLSGLINFAHPNDDALEAGETRLYRYRLQESEQMLAFVIPGQGDPDLYIWPPDHQSRGPWVTNLRDAVDEIGFVAPLPGVYQMEVTGFTPATYRTVVEVRAGGARLSPAANSNLDPTKPLRGKPYVPVSLLPFSRYGLPLGPLPPAGNPPTSPPQPQPVPLRLYLPGVQR